MSLSPALVYRRTDQGLREVYEKSHQFTQSERLVLILLDGRLDVGSLRERLPSLDDERIELTLGKLEEAGLIESASPASIPSSSPAEEVMRLEPKVVAQFLEQSDLDPLTGSEDAAAAAALMEALPESRAGGDTGGGVSRMGAAKSDSDRSHTSSSPSPFDDPHWDSTQAAAFAITTVNVPDRLDMREEQDRQEMEEYAVRRRSGLESSMKWLLLAAVALVIGAVLYGVVKPLAEAASAPRVGERLSVAFKRPVTVASSEFQVAPSPRLVLRGIDVGGDFAVEQVTLLLHWKDLWAALNGGQWAWGQAAVAPLTMSTGQAIAAVKAIPAAASELPASISTIRFESVQLPGSRLFPGRYEATLRRTQGGAPGPLIVRQLDGGEGSLQIQFRPSAEAQGETDFALEAHRWVPPMGPRTRWNDVIASGRIGSQVVDVSSYAVRGFYGITTGRLYLAHDVEWVVSGTAEGGSIDVESVFRALPAQGSTEGRPTPLQGTASLNLVIVGRGASAEEAIARSVAAGPFSVRFAVLNGVNLGLAATQGAAAAGSTRFTEFGGTIVVTSTGVRFEDTGGRAGAMTARANFTVAPDMSIAGGIRVELGGARVQAPITMKLSGTATQPRFAR